jgi:hypothetical protein
MSGFLLHQPATQDDICQIFINNAQKSLCILCSPNSGYHYLGWFGINVFPGGKHQWQCRWVPIDHLAERLHYLTGHLEPPWNIVQHTKAQEVVDCATTKLFHYDNQLPERPRLLGNLRLDDYSIVGEKRVCWISITACSLTFIERSG